VKQHNKQQRLIDRIKEYDHALATGKFPVGSIHRPGSYKK
jgi:hypothetical protein